MHIICSVWPSVESIKLMPNIAAKMPNIAAKMPNIAAKMGHNVTFYQIIGAPINAINYELY